MPVQVFNQDAISYQRLTSAGGVLLKPGRGQLIRVIVNTPTAASATATLYDGLNNQSDIIGAINLWGIQQTNLGVLSFTYGVSPGFSLDYGLTFQNGLFVQLSNAADVTVLFM